MKTLSRIGMVVYALGLGASRVDAAADPPLFPEDRSLVSSIHDAGCKGDISNLNQVVDALRHPKVQVRMTALWTLARLGRRDALPAVLNLIQDGEAPLEVNLYARVVAAQIKATANGPARDAISLRLQMQAFVQELELTPERVAEILARTNRPLAPDQEMDPDRAFVLLVLGQLADMVLVAANRGLLNGAAQSPLDLSLDPGSKLKAELSGYRPAQRIPRLIALLQSIKVITTKEYYPIQALIDEGPAAGAAVIAALEEMRKTTDKYTDIPFAALFLVLEGIGGPEATREVASFLDDPNERIRHFARQSHHYLAAGIRRNRIVNY